MEEVVHASRDGFKDRLNTPSPSGHHRSRPSEFGATTKGVAFRSERTVHRYPPAVWNEEQLEEEDDETEWDDEAYEDEDPDLAAEEAARSASQMGEYSAGVVGRGHRRDMEVNMADSQMMEPEDPMGWDERAAAEMQAQARAQAAAAAAANARALPSSQAAMSRASPSQQQPQQQQQQDLRQQTSRERLQTSPAGNSSRQASSPTRMIDPAEAGEETRKITMTPSVARDEPQQQQQQPQQQMYQSSSQTAVRPSPGATASTASSGGPLLPSDVMRRQDEERKRTREEIETLEDAQRKKNRGGPVSSSSNSRPAQQGGGKLRKQPDTASTDDEGNGKEKGSKKSGGIFGGLFGRRKDKKEKSSGGDSIDIARGSEESGRSGSLHSNSAAGHPDPSLSPITAAAMQQQRNTALDSRRMATQQQQSQMSPTPSSSLQLPAPSTPPTSVSSSLRQRDQQLYQKYLNSSPASPPQENDLAFAGSARGVGLELPSGIGHTPRQRPGSLIFASSTASGGAGDVGVPELSVIRVFAGQNLQTEATFKTVLLNSTTSSAELVRQAIQRFRLPGGDDEEDYYLTVKQVEGSSAVLLPDEKPLGVFESLVQAAMELPKVKRSSVGSISSVTSNLSMLPAIKKLPMNDFTDDSAVKFYLNRKGEEANSEAGFDDTDGDITMVADSTLNGGEMGEAGGASSHYLGVGNVAPERFSSPSYRFALQLVIHPEDLPDDMVFDPMTEAIIPKRALRDRSSVSSVASSGISQNFRRKVFVFAKNVTVAEVVETGLERFGILEGVVDGGDEVEDKSVKRRSSTRLRYNLFVEVPGNAGKTCLIKIINVVTDHYTHVLQNVSWRRRARSSMPTRAHLHSGRSISEMTGGARLIRRSCCLAIWTMYILTTQCLPSAAR
jgi:hypothetical protein